MVESGKKTESTETKLDDVTRKFDVLLEKMLPTQTGVLGGAPRLNNTTESLHSQDREDPRIPTMSMKRIHHNYFNAKIDFSYFDNIIVHG